MRVKEVLNQIKKGELTKLEKLEFIEKTTKGYKEEKVELLRREIKSEIFRIKRKHKTDLVAELSSLLRVIQDEYSTTPFDEIFEMSNNCLAKLSNQTEYLNLQALYDSWRYKGETVSEKNKREPCYLIMALYYLKKEYGVSKISSLMDILELISFDLLINQSQNKREPEKRSNNAKLPKADEWIVPIIQKIKSLDKPYNKDIINIFEEAYPGLVLEFGNEKINEYKFARGIEVNKTSVARVLKFIYEKKYPGTNIGVEAIIKRYRTLGHW